MAKAQITLPDELMFKLSSLSNNLNQTIDQTLKAGAKVMLPEVKSTLSRSLSGKSSGDLLLSLGTSPIKDGRHGRDIKVGFAEPRSDGKSNAMVANILEYGSSKQKASPFIRPAKRRGQKRAVEQMQKTLEDSLR